MENGVIHFNHNEQLLFAILFDKTENFYLLDPPLATINADRTALGKLHNYFVSILLGLGWFDFRLFRDIRVFLRYHFVYFDFMESILLNSYIIFAYGTFI